MNILYHAHSGLRYVVLLAAVAALLALAYALASNRPVPAARILTAAFTGLLDLQVLLGIALAVGGLFPDAAVGHLAMMILAAVAMHAASIIAQRSRGDRRANIIRLGGIALALVLIVGGIMAIGRSVFGSAPPTIG